MQCDCSQILLCKSCYVKLEWKLMNGNGKFCSILKQHLAFIWQMDGNITWKLSQAVFQNNIFAFDFLQRVSVVFCWKQTNIPLSLSVLISKCQGRAVYHSLSLLSSPYLTVFLLENMIVFREGTGAEDCLAGGSVCLRLDRMTSE